jgi:hypothetical protein
MVPQVVKTLFNMASVGREISSRATFCRSKNLLKSAIQKAGLSVSCLTSPSTSSSDAFLQAAMQQGSQLSCRKKRVPAYTKAMDSEAILAQPPTECAVCICRIEAQGDVSEASMNCRALQLGCGHFFHPDCIKPWLVKSASCPTCRWECKKMRHPRARASAQLCADGWEDEPLQVGDTVWIQDLNTIGEVIRTKLTTVDVMNSSTGHCYECPVECVFLLANGADGDVFSAL